MIDSFGRLFQLCGSDKQGVHDYGPVYDALFPTTEARGAVRRVLELGGGPSGRAWATAFPAATAIVMADGNPDAVKPQLIPPARAVKCDFAERAEILKAADGERFDLIVDDGSHLLRHMLLAWAVLYGPHLAPGGVYVVEDVQSQEDLDVLLRLPGAELHDRRASKRYDDVCVVFRKPTPHAAAARIRAFAQWLKADAGLSSGTAHDRAQDLIAEAEWLERIGPQPAAG